MMDEWVALVPGADDARAAGRLAYRARDSWEAARIGDVEALREHLLAGAEVNATDAFGGTLLYYASLCGQSEAVALLLERGARCAEHSHEGERCHYAALTDGIRQCLRQWSAVNRLRGPLTAFAFRLFDNPAAEPDVTFVVGEETISAHTWLLAARSPFYAARFGVGGRWHGRRTITLVSPLVRFAHLRAAMMYLYTDRIVVARADLHDMVLLADTLRLRRLARRLRAWLAAGGGNAAAAAHAATQSLADNLSDEYNPTEPPALPTPLDLEVAAHGGGHDGGGMWAWHAGDLDLRGCLWHVLLRGGAAPIDDDEAARLTAAAAATAVASPAGGAGDVGGGAAASPPTALGPLDADLLMLVTDGSEPSGGAGAGAGTGGASPLRAAPLVFAGHTALLCRRSAYLESMVRFHHLVRSTSGGGGAAVTAAVEPAAIERRRHLVELCELEPCVVACVLDFLYADVVRPLPTADHVIAALWAAELMCVGSDGLKPLLVMQALRLLDRGNAVDMLRVGDLLDLRRLTTAAARVIAAHLDEMVCDDGLAQLVRDSAGSIQRREASDSVPVLDEIAAAVRYLHRPTYRALITDASTGLADEAETARAAARAAGISCLVRFAASLGIAVALAP